MIRHPIVIDCDPGIDDALALLLALSSSQPKVAAVTTVAGNVPVQACTRNALRVLAVACPHDAPPVHQGAAGPVSGAVEDRAFHVHGQDGLGDLDPIRYPDPSGVAVPPPGPDVLVRLARQQPGQLTLVATGPLTNLAQAVRLDREALRLYREIVVMGGAVRVRGNVTRWAEFNIWSDPEALEILLAESLPLVLVPLDVTRQVVLTQDHLKRLPADAPRTRLIRDCTRSYMRFHKEATGVDGCILHDPLALGVALDPSFVGTEVVRLEVVTETGPYRGMTREVLPGAGRGRGGRVQVCTSVDAGRFLEFFLSRLGSEP